RVRAAGVPARRGYSGGPHPNPLPGGEGTESSSVPRPPSPLSGPRGRVARYAWGADYHKVIEAKLKALAEWLRERCGPDLPVKTFVDVGRMLDRAAAQRAGLGWFGKNTNILSRRQGSWIFLAEPLTNVPLLPDPPVPTHRGTCTPRLT